MVGSFNKIDYRLRPAKHAERSMLIDLFRRLRFFPSERYQYVGFGSVAFVDFRMVHRALGIKEMISIEGTDDAEERKRFRKNKPYRRIKLKFGMSGAVLPTINFKRPSIVWLDYDQPVRRSMALDVSTVARDAPSGSFVAVTFTNDFPIEKKKAETALRFLKEGFPEFVSPQAKPIDFQAIGKYAEFVRSSLGALLSQQLSDADAGIQDPNDKRRCHQVCFFKYNDNANMATIGWLIVADRDLNLMKECSFSTLPFYRSGQEAFTIKIPKVTPLEVREMEQRLPNLGKAKEVSWIPLRDRESFSDSYRYLPNFAPVEAI